VIAPLWRSWFWWRVLAFFFARYELIPAPSGAKYLGRWHFPRWITKRVDPSAEHLFLHYFYTSDPDRGWHNHPYVWCESELLQGAYVQEIRVRYGMGHTFTETFRAGDRNALTDEFHAVRLLATPVWTLFRAGPKHGKSWGFIDRSGKFWPANSGGMQ